VSTLEEVVLVNSMLAAILGVLVSLATRIWRNPYVAHALWLLVLAKLITPPIVPVTLWDIPSSSESVPAQVHAGPEFEQKFENNAVAHESQSTLAIVDS
jgi:hypothetical protein